MLETGYCRFLESHASVHSVDIGSVCLGRRHQVVLDSHSCPEADGKQAHTDLYEGGAGNMPTSKAVL